MKKVLYNFIFLTLFTCSVFSFGHQANAAGRIFCRQDFQCTCFSCQDGKGTTHKGHFSLVGDMLEGETYETALAACCTEANKRGREMCNKYCDSGVFNKKAGAYEPIGKCQ